MSKDFYPSKHGHFKRPQVSADFDPVGMGQISEPDEPSRNDIAMSYLAK
jgi:hypothetical protein